MKLAISGPTGDGATFCYDQSVFVRVAEDFEKRLTGVTTVVSGAAYGVDTVGVITARRLSPPLPVILTAPVDQWFNKKLLGHGLTVIEVHGTYMNRNDVTAEEGDALVAYPLSSLEELRSGTWSTIRRFRKRNKPVTIVPLDSL